MASQDFNIITIWVMDRAGKMDKLELPTDVSLSLMEVLKAAGYPIAATCGGMALCATCHVEILAGVLLSPPGEAELDMLEQLPDASPDSRLACQLRTDRLQEGMIFRLMPEG